MVTEITMNEISRGILNNHTSMVMFYGATCGPCKATMPYYEEVSQEYSEINFYKINAWEPEEQKNYCSSTWGVRGVPHFKMFHNGREVHTRVGGGDASTLRTFIEEGLFNTNFSVNKMKIKRLSESAMFPQKAHAGDLGYDLFSAENIDIFPGETKLISTGVSIQFPIRYGGLIRDRSSMATKRKLFTVAGVIDNGYIGEMKVAMHNAGYNLQKINAGDKIAQLVMIPVTNFEVEEVSEVFSADQRGVGGFGSTGT